MQLDCASYVCTERSAGDGCFNVKHCFACSSSVRQPGYVPPIYSSHYQHIVKISLGHINLQLLLLNCILYIYFIVYFNMHNLLLLRFFVSKYNFVRIHIFFLFYYWNVKFRNVYVCAILVVDIILIMYFRCSRVLSPVSGVLASILVPLLGEYCPFFTSLIVLTIS